MRQSNKELLVTVILLDILLIGGLLIGGYIGSHVVNNDNKPVINCIDGDTFAINNVYYRLSYIDTPEKGEYNYVEASRFTCDYLHNHSFVGIEHGKDKYGRTLIDIKGLNTALISNCLATPFYGKTTDNILNIYNNNCK